MIRDAPGVADGAAFLVLDCADDEASRRAAEHPTVRCCVDGACQHARGERDAERRRRRARAVVFHLTPSDVATRPAYDDCLRAKRARVGGNPDGNPRTAVPATHVNCGVSGEIGFRASARVLARLHAVDAETFPIPTAMRAPYAPPRRAPGNARTRGTRRAEDGSLCAVVTLYGPSEDEDHGRREDAAGTDEAHGRREDGTNMDDASSPRLLDASLVRRRLDPAIDHHSARAEELDVDAAVESVSRLVVANEPSSRVEPTASSSGTRDVARRAPTAPAELLFLGTGSAEPSKYRGASGILLRLPPDAPREPPGYVLLDAGEGVSGALTRHLGRDGARDVVARLRAVYVSHAHADHVLGVPGVLFRRRNDAPPLAVVGPEALHRWLRAGAAEGGGGWRFVRCSALFEGGGGPFHIPGAQAGSAFPTPRAPRGGASPQPFPQQFPQQFPQPPPPPPPPPPPAGAFPPPPPRPSPPPPPFSSFPPPPRARPPPHPFAREIGLCRFECVPVRHCPDASAVILEHPSGAMRVAYSGDCRPSTRLADAARGVHVFVHEATFEDDLASHAESKRHSTTSEALQTTTRAGAKLAVLTHFSQRYPRAVAAVDGATGAPAVTAFDGARVRWDRLEKMPDVARRVDEMFAAARDADAAERDTHPEEDEPRGDGTKR